MKCEFFPNKCGNKPWKLHISRFDDITHETVVTIATDFGIL